MISFHGAHVVIIEDDPSSVDVLIQLLEQLAITYTTLIDSRGALETIQQLPRVDAIFLDLEMPSNNGYEVLEALKQDPMFAHIPIIAYTAHLSEMSNARNAGFHSFMGKPLRSSDFPAQME